MNRLKTAIAVRYTGIVAQVDVIIIGHQLLYFAKNSESTVTGVKNTNGRGQIILHFYELHNK